jgi:hypothetical protein
MDGAVPWPVTGDAESRLAWVPMTSREGSHDDLRSGVSDVVADMEGVTERSLGGAIEYRRGEQVFAVVDGGAVEIRLRPDIAEAILRTPETAQSGRGPEWVRFAPQELDPAVADRLEAWLIAAWRAAGR